MQKTNKLMNLMRKIREIISSSLYWKPVKATNYYIVDDGL